MHFVSKPAFEHFLDAYGIGMAGLPPFAAHIDVPTALGTVQAEPISGPDDEARWLDEALAGLGLDRVHLLGVTDDKLRFGVERELVCDLALEISRITSRSPAKGDHMESWL